MTTAYEFLAERLAARGDDIARVEARLAAQEIETPSWAFGNSGTRFGVFAQPGAPRNTSEKLEDAAQVHRYTGTAPSVALHIPWDSVDDFGALRDEAAGLGLRLGAINPNLFQEDDYKLGSVCNPDPRVRQRSVDHILECVAVATQTGSDVISLWLADGTNYAGQDSLSGRRDRLVDALRTVYAALPEGMQLFVEYKFYEPAFYSTDLPDWGTALTLCQELGAQANVLVDLGHHAHSVNIEQIVALLQRMGRLGGFHFNDRKYGDDDLIVGSVDPFQLFRIFFELVVSGALGAPGETGAEGDAVAGEVRLTIDQSHNIEGKLESMIHSVVNLQEAYAKALLVDRNALELAQVAGDVLGGHRLLLDAFSTDVRPLCAKVRADLGAAEDPVAAFRASGYAADAAEKRAEGAGAGWR